MSATVIEYDRGMGRWEPNARGRLEQAAMELYIERGFEPTTVAEIARRAGLTERTFFRHFTDKREVLFAGAASLQDFLVTALASAPDSATPLTRSPRPSRPPVPSSKSAVTTPGSGRPSSRRTPSSRNAS